MIYGIICWLVSLAWTIGSRAETKSKANQEGAHRIAPVRQLGTFSSQPAPHCRQGIRTSQRTSKPAIHCTLLAQNSYKQPGNYILAPTLNFSKRKVHSGQQKWVSRPPQQMCLILNRETGILVNTPVSLGLVRAKARPGVTALLLGCWKARSSASEKHCHRKQCCLYESGIFPETMLVH